MVFERNLSRNGIEQILLTTKLEVSLSPILPQRAPSYDKGIIVRASNSDLF